MAAGDVEALSRTASQGIGGRDRQGAVGATAMRLVEVTANR